MQSSGRSHDELNQESLEIKKDEKFFTRIMSKETSMANSSCRVYYGGASGAVPFTWESRPGTPKHTSFADNTSNIPPLTPPPSYYSTSKSKSMRKRTKQNLFNTIIPRLMTKKTSHVSPSSSMSSTTTSSSSSSWTSRSSSSSYHSSPATFNDSKSRKHPCFVCSKSPIHYGVDDDDEEHGLELFSSSRLCYGGKSKGLNVFGGRYIMENMKSALLSIVGHGNNGHGSAGKANY
ncbi:conserved hypothetical protein [Ricinus communis]|uniref:Uncharacterized protein n=1 Tax=Ricinus communis TaxID=3988 RepID=B9S4B9_RICCO|nr:conserved hypothetical protein [Ricinus communis]|eukprot:XP_002520838.1 uncharacterized protein LOC8259522 [Ricinus communis]